MNSKELDLGPKTAALIQRLANEEQQQQARIAAANRTQEATKAVATVYVYLVDEDQADDPEAAVREVLTNEEIVDRYPDIGGLFTYADGTESLTFTHELYRLRIRPA